MIKKILVPLDGSKLAENVLPYVEELALKLNAEAVFISITNRVQGYWPFEDASQPDEVRLVPRALVPWKNRPQNILTMRPKGWKVKGSKQQKRLSAGKPLRRSFSTPTIIIAI